MQTIDTDREILLAIVKEMAESFTGAQSTKHWADNALFFDIPPIAAKGKKKSCEIFEHDFRRLKSIDVEILLNEIIISGDMGIACSVQRWNIIMKDDTEKTLMVRQTNCFQRLSGEWKLIHQHDSIPAGGNWDGKILE